MKHAVLTLMLMTPDAFAAGYYEDNIEQPITPPAPMVMPDPLEYRYRQPMVVTPIEPSPTGSSYIGNEQIRTPKMECYRSVATGALVCQGY